MISSRLSAYFFGAFFAVMVLVALNGQPNQANSQQRMTLEKTDPREMRENDTDYDSNISYGAAPEYLSPTMQADVTLTCGSLVPESIDAPAEVDQFIFSGQLNQRVTLTLAESGGFPGSTNTATATLFSPTGQQLLVFSANSQQQITLGATGTYAIQVRANNLVAIGSYVLGLECLLPTSPVDVALACGSLAMRTIDTPAQVDQFIFSGQLNQQVTLTLAESGGFPGSTNTATATLFSPTGQQLLVFSANSQQQITLGATGTYIIQVRANNFFATGSYMLGLECLLPASPIPTLLTITKITPTANPDSISVTAFLSRFPGGPGLALDNKSIRFTIDDTQSPAFVEAVTDSNGMATAELDLSNFSSLNPRTAGTTGMHTLFALFDSDPAFEFSSAASTFFLGPQAGGCQVLIFTADETFAANGGTGTFNVTSFPQTCGWTATSNDPWIQIDSGNGTGDGLVAYTVDRHIDPNTRRVGTISVATLTFTVLQGVAFLDVPESDLFYTAIGKLSARAVTLGCGAGNYCPDESVTREQMAAFIIRALGDFNPPPPTSQRFLDVPPSNPFYAFIEQMAVRQITLGCGGGNYCPAHPVLREQMAAFLIRAVGELTPPMPVAQRFVDVPPSHTFFNFIERMAVRRVTLGCSASPPLYCPVDSVTRGQMAAFLVRAFNL
jgi:hypothetical protein